MGFVGGKVTAFREQMASLAEKLTKPAICLVSGAILAILTLVFYHQIAFTNSAFVNYDLFTYFYPYRSYAAEALRSGQVPLWNPYIFVGVPFLANIQTAVFYPLNLLVYAFGYEAPRSINILIILHVFLAGLGMYAFAKISVKLDHAAALLAGLVFMFSGFLSQQMGHVNQQNVAAWIPIVFLFFDLACRRKSVLFACLTALAIAFQFLAGHSQESYLTLFALGLFYLFQLLLGIGRAFNLGQKSIRGLSTHLVFTGKMLGGAVREVVFITGVFVAVVALGVGLAAVQLLPTYELAGESIRGGGLSYKDATSFSLPPWELLRALLPGYMENPFSEFVGYVGFLPLSLAILAFAVRKDNPFTLFSLLLVALAIFFALGGFNPLYPIVFKLLPGLNLFRVPARWLFIYTFAIATMAGIGMSCLTRPPLIHNPGRDLIRTFRSSQFWIVFSLLVVFGIIWLAHPMLKLPRGEVLAVWIPLVGLSIALILVGPLWAPDPKLTLGVLSLVVLELFFAQSDLDLNHPVPIQAYSSLRPSILQLKTDDSIYRALSISIGTFDPGDMPDLKLILRDQLTTERITDFIVATKYKEILTPNLGIQYRIPTVDGYDGGVLPLKDYADFKRLIIESEDPPHGKAPGSNFEQADGLLREQLDGIPSTQLLGMLNVKYVISDKAHDPWVDNVYYDLGSMLRVNKSSSPRLTNLPSFASTAVGIVSYLTGAQNLTTTTPVATVAITDSAGRTYTTTLLAGVDTAEGDYNRPFVKVGHKMARVSSLWRGNPQAYNYYTKVDLKGLTYPKEIRFATLADGVELDVRGLSLIDERIQASEPVILNQRLKLVHSGDIKIYENLDWLPRAYLVRRFEVAQGAAALAALKKDVREKAVLSTNPPLSSQSLSLMSEALTRPTRDEVTIESYEPQKVRVKANLSAPGILVLTDAYYPGWQASIDGKPATILRANYMFRAVALTEGEHIVEFSYQPDSLRTGLYISLIAGGVGAGALGITGLVHGILALFALVRSRGLTVTRIQQVLKKWRR